MSLVINDVAQPPCRLGSGSFRLFRAFVREVARLSPNLTRITFGGPELAGMIGGGLDQRIKLLFPRRGQARPWLPDDRDYRCVRTLNESVRPILRTYTLRAHRSEHLEFDVDFVLHGTNGPGSAFASRARPGDEIAVGAPALDHPHPARLPGVEYDLARLHGQTLIVGDETALPAIGGIVEALPRGVRALVYADIPDFADAPRFATLADVQARWFAHHGRTHKRYRDLLGAVRSARVDGDRCYAWVAGESGMVRAVRRLLIQELGFSLGHSTFMGYWKQGRAGD
jgi:NADPH-dependent ferric siderophore reductase